MLYVLGRGYIMKWLDHDFLHRYLIVNDVHGGFSFIQLSFLTYTVLKYFPENTQRLDRVQPRRIIKFYPNMFNTSTDWAKILFSMLLQNWLLQVLKALWTECHWLITGLLHILYSQQHSSPTFHTHTFKKNQMRFINLCTWLWTFLEAATTSSHITCPADLSITHSDFHRGSKCSTQCKSELHESVFVWV